MTALTRGPLPAGVYWRRRLLVALLAVGLLVAAVRLLGPGSEDPSPTPRATQVAADPASSPPAPQPSDATATEPVAEPRARQRDEPEHHRGRERDAKRERGPVLAEPEGVCSDRDVAVTPSVRSPVGGRPVTFDLALRTITAPACTWQVSPTTLTMKITSGPDDIWSSVQCPRAIPTEDVVVRNNATTEVEVTWSGRRSDEECSGATEWAMPGWYWVDVAALAGEPSDLHFELTAPEPGVKKVREPQREREGRQRQEDDGDRSGGQHGQARDRDGQGRG